MLRTLILLAILTLTFFLQRPTFAEEAARKLSVADKFNNVKEAVIIMFSDYTEFKEAAISTFTFGAYEYSFCNTLDKTNILTQQRDILDFLITNYRGISGQKLISLLNERQEFEAEYSFLNQADKVNEFVLKPESEEKAKLKAQIVSQMIIDSDISDGSRVATLFENFLKSYRKRFDETTKIKGEYGTCKGPYAEVQKKIDRIKELTNITKAQGSLASQWTQMTKKLDFNRIQDHYEKMYNEDLSLLKNMVDDDNADIYAHLKTLAKNIANVEEVGAKFREANLNKSKALSKSTNFDLERKIFDDISSSKSEAELIQNIGAGSDLFGVTQRIIQAKDEIEENQSFQIDENLVLKEIFQKSSSSIHEMTMFKSATNFGKAVDTKIDVINKKSNQFIDRQCS